MKSRLGIIASAMLLSACSIVPSTSSDPAKSPSVKGASEAPKLKPGEDPYYEPLWTLEDIGFKSDVSTHVEIVGDTAIIRAHPIPQTVQKRMPDGLDEGEWTEYVNDDWLAVVDIPSRKVRWEMPADMFKVTGLEDFNALPEVQNPGVYVARSEVVVGFIDDQATDLADLNAAGGPGIASIDPDTMKASWASTYKPVTDRDALKVGRQFVGSHDDLVIQTIDEHTGGEMAGPPKHTWHRRTQAYNASTGKLAWERKGLFALTVTNGVILARTLPPDATAKNGSPFEALDAATGKTLWRTKTRTKLFGVSNDWVLFARNDADTTKKDPTKGVYALKTGAKKVALADDESPAFPEAGDSWSTDRVAGAGDGVVWSSNGRKPNKVSWMNDGASAPVSMPVDNADYIDMPTPVVANDQPFAFGLMESWTFLDKQGQPVGDPLPLPSNDARVILSGSYLALVPQDIDSPEATISLYRLVQ
ncbi:hypothetical protein ACIA03_08510 [Nocardioides sp. NPDC051685]|uniref:hypothetical protein n=1 Tax=Nocardioides sp. NPDC051685 TaxID=3364334 RepID=UPI0037B32F08